MAYLVPDIAAFKARFNRDFPYGATDDSVKDADITNALSDVAVNFNDALWSSQDIYTLAYLYMAAHCLVMNLREASGGVDGKFSWLETSKSVGSVSQGLAVPQSIQDSPIFSYLSKTTYGVRYLMMALPRIIGNVFTVHGETHP